MERARPRAQQHPPGASALELHSARSDCSLAAPEDGRTPLPSDSGTTDFLTFVLTTQWQNRVMTLFP